MPCTISRAAFQSLFASFRPSSIAAYEKRTSCVERVLEQPVARRVGAVRSSTSNASMPLPSDFDMRRPSGASTVGWMTTSSNGPLAEQLEPGEDHAVLPEPDDVARRRVHVARIELRELRRLLGPAERRERPQRGAEPRVEHVGLPRQLGRPALGAGGRLAGAPPSRDRPGSTTPGSGAPTRSAARCTSRARSRASRSRSGAGSPGGSGSRRSRSASSGGCLISSIEHHHCSEMRGSMREWQRSQNATLCR